MPGNAAGNNTVSIISDRVEPSASAPSRIDWGTEERASSAKDEMNGMSITPITLPAANAVFGATDNPRKEPASLIAGATTRIAKNP